MAAQRLHVSRQALALALDPTPTGTQSHGSEVLQAALLLGKPATRTATTMTTVAAVMAAAATMAAVVIIVAVVAPQAVLPHGLVIGASGIMTTAEMTATMVAAAAVVNKTTATEGPLRLAPHPGNRCLLPPLGLSLTEAIPVLAATPASLRWVLLLDFLQVHQVLPAWERLLRPHLTT